MCLSVRVNNIRSFLCVHKCGKKELDKDHVIFRAFIIVKKKCIKIIGQTLYFKPNYYNFFQSGH